MVPNPQSMLSTVLQNDFLKAEFALKILRRNHLNTSILVYGSQSPDPILNPWIIMEPFSTHCGETVQHCLSQPSKSAGYKNDNK